MGEQLVTAHAGAGGRVVSEDVPAYGAALKLDIVLVQAMYRQADSFLTVSVKVFEDLKRDHPSPGYAYAPFVVNMTFSLELYLKTLARVHGAALSRKHKLLDLYEELPVDARLAVTKAISKALANEETVVHNLRNLNDAFTQWRYLYEPSDQTKMIEPHSAIWVAGVLQQACLESGWLAHLAPPPRAVSLR
jgi:hypothetical protein